MGHKKVKIHNDLFTHLIRLIFLNVIDTDFDQIMDGFFRYKQPKSVILKEEIISKGCGMSIEFI
ncbi:MAG: hypothetical protein ACFE8N_13945 [Promethearchaeota archaeon]